MFSFNADKNQKLLNWARQGNLGFVREALAEGAEINTTTSGGISALHLAASGGHWQIAEELLSAAPAADPNLAADGGRTPLMSAMQACNERVVALLLAKGAKVDLSDREGWTALHHAASKGKKDIVELLLNAGADFMAKDFMGRTPAAIAKGNSAVALLAEKERDFLMKKKIMEQENISTGNISKLDKLLPRHKRP